MELIRYTHITNPYRNSLGRNQEFPFDTFCYVLFAEVEHSIKFAKHSGNRTSVAECFSPAKYIQVIELLVAECFCSSSVTECDEVVYRSDRSYIISVATRPVPTGNSMLSRSPEGIASINVDAIEMITATFTEPEITSVVKNTDTRHTLEPAYVFPPVKGMAVLPKSFPKREEKPSPNARA